MTAPTPVWRQPRCPRCTPEWSGRRRSRLATLRTRTLSSPTIPRGRPKDSARILQALPWKLLSTPRCGDRDAHQREDTIMRDRSRRHLRPVRDVAAPSLQFVTIHGHRRAFRIAGSGPVILMLHGVGDNSMTWEPVHAKLAQRFTVIAPRPAGPRRVRQAARRLLVGGFRQRHARPAHRPRHRPRHDRGAFAGTTTRRDTKVLFVLIGAEAVTDWLPPDISRDQHGFVLTGTDAMRAGQ